MTVLDADPSQVSLDTAKELGFLDAEDYDEVTQMLNPAELTKLLESYAEIIREAQEAARKPGRIQRPNPKLDDQWKVDYKRRPPTIKEFIYDPYWLGKTVGLNLFEGWKEILLRDFDWDSSLSDIVLTGSLGSGKTHVLVVMMLYRIAITTLLRDPCAFFHMTPGSPIVYAILSTSVQQVRKTAFTYACSWMAQSEYFLSECNFDPDLKYAENYIEFPGKVRFVIGSKGGHVIGQNVAGIGFDEGNWRQEKDPDRAAYELFADVRDRMRSRFQTNSKDMPVISIIASSARDESSFTETMIAEVEEAHDPKHQMVYRKAAFRIKGIGRDKPWFRVAWGLKGHDPAILQGFYDKDANPIEGIYDVKGRKIAENKVHEIAPAGANIEYVPVCFLMEFKRRTREALQNICGIATGGSSHFLPSTINIIQCIELSTADGVVNPAKPGVFSMAISKEDNLNIWDYLDHSKFLARVSGAIIPLRHPYAKRYLHLDLATETQAGLAICHRCPGQVRVDGVVGKDGEPFSEYRVIVEYDFLLSIIAGQTSPINFSKVEAFIHWLHQMCGYRFGLCTADQYQSVGTLQSLEASGFEVGNLSVDRDKKAYIAWRQSLQELRLRLYEHPVLMKEAEELVETTKKVDHPADGGKDLADAAAGAHLNCISGEATSLNSDTPPEMHTNRSLSPQEAEERPIVEIPIPQGPTKIQIFM